MSNTKITKEDLEKLYVVDLKNICKHCGIECKNKKKKEIVDLMISKSKNIKFKKCLIQQYNQLKNNKNLKNKNSSNEYSDLENFYATDLKTIARNCKIKGFSKMKKDQLVGAIKLSPSTKCLSKEYNKISRRLSPKTKVNQKTLHSPKSAKNDYSLSKERMELLLNKNDLLSIAHRCKISVYSYYRSKTIINKIFEANNTDCMRMAHDLIAKKQYTPETIKVGDVGTFTYNYSGDQSPFTVIYVSKDKNFIKIQFWDVPYNKTGLDPTKIYDVTGSIFMYSWRPSVSAWMKVGEGTQEKKAGYIKIGEAKYYHNLSY